MLLSWILSCTGTGTIPPDPTDPTTVPSDVCAERPGEVLCEGDVLVTCDDSGAVAATEDCAAAGGLCDEALGACVTCDETTLRIPYADAASPGLFLEADPVAGPFEERRFRMRPVVVQGRGELAVTGPFELLGEDGAAVSGEIGPATVYLHATGPGTGSLTLTPGDACPGAPVTLELVAGTSRGLAGRALSGHPWLEDWRLFTDRDTVEASVDPHVFFDRVGQPFDAYVVAHRTPAEWAADPDLSGGVAGPVPGSVTAGSVADGLLSVWSTPPLASGLYADYDLVLDFGQDGTFDPGDLVDGFDEPGLSVSGDLSAPGPFTPIQGEISVDYWHTMRVYAPQEVDKLDPMPIVAISHGNGHDYTWYDYLGQHLASHGYVVMSHRNNTGPGTITAAQTTWTNTDVFLGQLPTWQQGFLDGEVDPHTIVWIGHSRGGESVAIARHWLETGEAAPAHYTASDIVLVSSIAPTIFEGPDVVNPHDTPYHLLAGSADGDVNGGASCSICQFFRILQRTTNENVVTYVQGADHNDFNCCGDNDFDWAQNVGPELGRQRAQQLAKSTWLALLESQLRGHEVLGEYLVRAPEGFLTPRTDAVVATQHKRATGDRKLVIDDFQSNPDPGVSSSGGTVTATVRELFEGALDDGQQACVFGSSDQCTFTTTDADPMNGMTQADGDADPARGLVLQWDQGDDDLQLELALPAGEHDLTDDTWLSFRAAQATRHENTNVLLDRASFSVALVDGQGNVSALDHRVYGGLTRPWARRGDGQGTGWANEFQSIRVPLSAFTADGRVLDLSDVVAVRFLFGPSWGSELGRVGLDDIEILGEGIR